MSSIPILCQKTLQDNEMAIQCMYNQYESFHLKTVLCFNSTLGNSTFPHKLLILSLFIGCHNDRSIMMLAFSFFFLIFYSSLLLSFQFHSQKCGLQHNQQQNLIQVLHFLISFYHFYQHL